MQKTLSFGLKIEWQIRYSFLFSKNRIHKLLTKIARFQDLRGDYGLSVHLVDGKEIRSLNRKHRKINQVTDVLSFPVGFSKLSFEAPNLLGDIFICVPQLLKQAKREKISKGLEFEILIVHGFLHLLGFEHEKDCNSWNKTLQSLYQNKILSYNHIRYAKKQTS